MQGLGFRELYCRVYFRVCGIVYGIDEFNPLDLQRVKLGNCVSYCDTYTGEIEIETSAVQA